ncbi:MAG TPA: hypothetical protein VGD60_02765 [Candidatus Acidoferrales bacterium]
MKETEAPAKPEPDEKTIRVIALVSEILSEPGTGEKQITLAETLRAAGFDEFAWTRLFFQVLGYQLECRKPESHEKLLAELLWKSALLLEPAGSVGDAAKEEEAPVQLEFTHSVPRPVRTRVGDPNDSK